MRVPERRRIEAAVSAMALLATAASHGAIFAKLEGVDGESKAVGREGWMNVSALGSKVAKEVELTSRTLAELPTADSFVLQKEIDKASPYLVEAILKGSEFPSFQVELVTEKGVTACYRMRGVRLTKHRLYSEEGRDQPLEEYGFGYDVIEWHHIREDLIEGRTHLGTTWDLALDTGGEVPDHLGEAPTILPVDPVEIEPGGRATATIRLLGATKDPSKLSFTVLSPANRMVEVVSVTGDGMSREVTIAAGDLLRGTDSLLLSITDGERSSTQQLPILVAGDRTPYEAYIEGFLGEKLVEDPEAGGLLEDPDKDKLSNAVEFYLGTDPCVFTPANEAISFEREKTEEGTEIRMKYFRRLDTTGLIERFHGTSDLQNWQILDLTTTPTLETETLPGGDGTYAPMEARIRIPAGSDEDYFMRFALEGFL